MASKPLRMLVVLEAVVDLTGLDEEARAIEAIRRVRHRFDEQLAGFQEVAVLAVDLDHASHRRHVGRVDLERAGLLHGSVSTVHSPSLGAALERWDVLRTRANEVHELFRAGPAGIPTQQAFSQSTRWPSLRSTISCSRENCWASAGVASSHSARPAGRAHLR